MMKSTFHLIVILSGLSLLGCVEEIDTSDQIIFEDALVVEATLTNELKIQHVYLSRTYKNEENGPKRESGAEVSLLENDNLLVNFYETTPGNYATSEPFMPESGIEYQLRINTSNGRSYLSNKVFLTKIVDIEKVYATREINSIGTEVLAINVDSYDPSNESQYYRYEYEETYKIVAPRWVYKDFVLLDDSPVPGFGFRPEEEKVCYKTLNSQAIIQTSTVNLSEDKVSKFPVRTIESNNPIIANTYSILVRQYVQSLEAFTYFKVLDQFSGSGNLFTQIQTGYYSSNIKSNLDSNEKVLGFFEVTSVSEKRIFVEYEEIFPGEEKPPYFQNCDNISAPLLVLGESYPLREAIESRSVKYFHDKSDPSEFEGPYEVVSRPCGDCTVYGTSEKPDFWVD